VIPKALKAAWIGGSKLKFEIVHGEVLESKTRGSRYQRLITDGGDTIKFGYKKPTPVYLENIILYFVVLKLHTLRRRIPSLPQ